MRRAALAVVAAVSLGAVGAAGTASNRVPRTTIANQNVTVSGATMKGVKYTVAANVITGLTVQLKGRQFALNALGLVTSTPLFTTVTGRFGAGTAVPCVIGLYDAVKDQTPATCTGFSQQANRSWSLRITVS